MIGSIVKLLVKVVLFVIVLGIGFFGVAERKLVKDVFKRYKKVILLGIPVLLAALIMVSCIYTVDQTEYAIISTFGKPNTQIVESGLKLKLPSPIQKVNKLSKETFSTTFGYKTKDGDTKLYEKETKMITGDENIIMADLEIQWKISDPIAFMYNTSDPKDILFNITSSSLKSVVGSSMVDDVLTDGRAKITSDIREDVSSLADQYKLGISIVNVNLQDVDLPTETVDKAFKAVTDAREERLTKINNAEKYKNEKINEVAGEKDAIISKAQASKVAEIEKAKGDVARFEALYKEYRNNKEITKHRLITNRLKTVLKNAKVYITDESGNTLKHLPIELQENVKGGK